MSQPRQPTPQQSPTPSKSSLRRTSGPQNPSQRSLIPPPSPRFEDQPAVPVRYSPRSPPNQTLEYESDEDDEPLIYPDPPAVDGAADADEDSYFPYPEPDQPFQPFFTLVEDGLTSEHHHPSVHYIFADDDTELITDAALYSLEQDELSSSSSADNPQEGAAVHRHSNSPKFETRLPLPPEGVREHYLILDVHPISQSQAQTHTQPQAHPHSHSHSQSHSHPTPTTEFIPIYTITNFTSLSPDWQITSASISSAPTMGEPDPTSTAASTGDESLMLRIEGRSMPPFEEGIDIPAPTGTDPKTNAPPVGVGKRPAESLEDMIERFQSRLGEVRRLIDLDGGLGGLQQTNSAGITSGLDMEYSEGRREKRFDELEEQD